MKNFLSLFLFFIFTVFSAENLKAAEAEHGPWEDYQRPHSHYRLTKADEKQVEYDIFNLHWGMKKADCYKLCDWGGKSDINYSFPNSIHVLKFKKGELFADLCFNDNDELYKVIMMSFFSKSKLSSAKDFYEYLNEILKRKYKYVNPISERLNFEKVMKTKVIYMSMFASPSSIITLILYRSFDKRFDSVLDLTYYSKKIKRTHISSKDAMGM